MSGGAMAVEQDVSLFSLGTALLHKRKRIVAMTVAGGFLSVAIVLSRPFMFRSYTSFFTQQTDAGRSGLASLAGQFGVALSSSASSISPEFYSRLARSPVVLRYIARDSITVLEREGQRMSVMDFLNIPQGGQEQREELAVRRLLGIITTQVVKATGVVEVAAVTPWPSVSHGIIQSLLDGVAEFNRVTKQGQATEERKFVEGRLRAAETELLEAEDRLSRFIRANRAYAVSPELSLEVSRLQRQVGLRQTVFTALTQSYDDVRIREVRDTPAITLIEAPKIPAGREARHTIRWGFVGAAAGLMFGVIWALLGRGVEAARGAGQPDVNEFFTVFDAVTARASSAIKPWARAVAELRKPRRRPGE